MASNLLMTSIVVMILLTAVSVKEIRVLASLDEGRVSFKCYDRITLRSIADLYDASKKC